jgi:class 3 adenylate cyclase
MQDSHEEACSSPSSSISEGATNVSMRSTRRLSAESRFRGSEGSVQNRLGPTVRGLSIVPRRISGMDRSEANDSIIIGKVFISSRPPPEIMEDLELIVQDAFSVVPRLVRELWIRGEYHEVELLLFKRTRKLIAAVKNIGVAREEGSDDGMAEPSTNAEGPESRPTLLGRIRGLFTNRRSDSFRKSLSKSLGGIVDSKDLSEWLTEFLFLIWYAALPSGQEQAMAGIRQACKQLVWRATASRTQIDRACGLFSPLLKLLPWRIRLLLGERGPMGEKSWSELQYDPFDRDSLKSRIGGGQKPSLHWLTREFQDPSVEKAFQVDYAARLMGSPYWPFFLTVALVIAYITVRYSLMHSDYPSITLVRLFIADPNSWMIIAAIVQLCMQTVLFYDSLHYRENFFFYQFLFSIIVCLVCSAWMYVVRTALVFVVWPVNEGFTMSYILVCVSFLFYVRFIYQIWLTIITTAFTLILRYSLPALQDGPMLEFPLQQGFAIVAAICVVFAGRYIFETHTRVDFVLTRTLVMESERSDRLLRNILPEQVIQHLKDHDMKHPIGSLTSDSTPSRASQRSRASIDGTVEGALPAMGIAEAYDKVTILFADVCGFTNYSSHISPEDLVLFLNELFTCFDDIAEECGLEKIKTIGDAYMAVCGLKQAQTSSHAVCAARMGLRITELMKSGRFRDHENNPLGTRVGIHSGSCVAGVIGRKKFIYDIWGDAVNTASRMESTGEMNMVHCTDTTAELIETQSPGDFEMIRRGEIEVKGKGSMQTFFVMRERIPVEVIEEEIS